MRGPRPRLCLAVAALALGATLPAPAAAQRAAADSGSAAELIGVVLTAEADSPVAGARVAAPDLGLVTITDHEGRFRLAGLPPGPHRFEIRLPGLPAREFRAEMAPGGSRAVELRVTTRIVPRPALEVEVRPDAPDRGRLDGFYRRRARGVGWFLDRPAIERRRPTEVSDLLRSVPGVVVSRGPGSSGKVAMERSVPLLSHRECRIGFFVDGVRVPPEDDFRLDELTPADLEAIEVYRGASEVPAIFLRPGEECGVVAVWTRDPSRP